jgi:hypothetical protein
MVPSRPRKNDNRIGYSRGEPTTPTPLTTRSKRKVIGSNIPSPSKKAKTMTKEVAFSKEVHYYDSDESYADPSPSSTKTGVSATKGNQKVTVIRNLALRKKPKKLHSPTLAAASGNSNVNSAADRQDAPKRSSTRSGLKFRK